MSRWCTFKLYCSSLSCSLLNAFICQFPYLALGNTQDYLKLCVITQHRFLYMFFLLFLECKMVSWVRNLLDKLNEAVIFKDLLHHKGTHIYACFTYSWGNEKKNPLGYIHKAVKFCSHFQYDIFVQAYLHFFLQPTHRNSKIFRFANYLFPFFLFNSLWFFKMFSLHCHINLIPINYTKQLFSYVTWYFLKKFLDTILIRKLFKTVPNIALSI